MRHAGPHVIQKNWAKGEESWNERRLVILLFLLLFSQCVCVCVRLNQESVDQKAGQEGREIEGKKGNEKDGKNESRTG